MRCGAALEVRDKRASGCMDNKGWDDLCTSQSQDEGSSPFYVMDVRTDGNRFEQVGLWGLDGNDVFYPLSSYLSYRPQNMAASPENPILHRIG